MLDQVITIASGLGTVFSAANVGWQLYKNISVVANGNKADGNLVRIADELHGLRISVERLSDQIWYAPSLEGVRNLTPNSPNRKVDLQEVRASLEPIQHALGNGILSSSMIHTPQKLFQSMHRNPFDVLVNIRPVHYAEPSSDPSLVPVVFEDRSVFYIGWTPRGSLPGMFDCEYNQLWLKNVRSASKFIEQPLNPVPRFLNSESLISQGREGTAREEPGTYRKLQTLLEDKQWQAADMETRELMLQAAGAGWRRGFDQNLCCQIPCSTLSTINELWLKHSCGNFSFCVQKQIYDSFNQDFWQFSKCIGWSRSSLVGRLASTLYKTYGEINFSLGAPKGHLPAAYTYAAFLIGQPTIMATTGTATVFGFSATKHAYFDAFMQRVEDCRN